MIVLAFAAGMWQAFAPKNPVSDRLLGPLAAAVYLGLLWRLYQTPCLNCRQPLGMGALWWVSGGLAADYSPHCPHCDVSIDREIPGASKP
jgi:hypothetical protein